MGGRLTAPPNCEASSTSTEPPFPCRAALLFLSCVSGSARAVFNNCLERGDLKGFLWHAEALMSCLPSADSETFSQSRSEGGGKLPSPHAAP